MVAIAIGGLPHTRYPRVARPENLRAGLFHQAGPTGSAASWADFVNRVTRLRRKPGASPSIGLAKSLKAVSARAQRQRRVAVARAPGQGRLKSVRACEALRGGNSATGLPEVNHRVTANRPATEYAQYTRTRGIEDGESMKFLAGLIGGSALITMIVLGAGSAMAGTGHYPVPPPGPAFESLPMTTGGTVTQTTDAAMSTTLASPTYKATNPMTVAGDGGPNLPFIQNGTISR